MKYCMIVLTKKERSRFWYRKYNQAETTEVRMNPAKRFRFRSFRTAMMASFHRDSFLLSRKKLIEFLFEGEGEHPKTHHTNTMTSENIFNVIADLDASDASDLETEEKEIETVVEKKVEAKKIPAFEEPAEGFTLQSKTQRQVKKAALRTKKATLRAHQLVEELATARGLEDGKRLIQMYGDAMDSAFEDALFCPDRRAEHFLGEWLVDMHRASLEAFCKARNWKSEEQRKSETEFFYQKYVPALIQGYCTSPTEEYYSTPLNFFSSLRTIFCQLFGTAFYIELGRYSDTPLKKDILKWREQWLSHLPKVVQRRKSYDSDFESDEE